MSCTSVRDLTVTMVNPRLKNYDRPILLASVIGTLTCVMITIVTYLNYALVDATDVSYPQLTGAFGGGWGQTLGRFQQQTLGQNSFPKSVSLCIKQVSKAGDPHECGCYLNREVRQGRTMTWHWKELTWTFGEANRSLAVDYCWQELPWHAHHFILPGLHTTPGKRIHAHDHLLKIPYPCARVRAHDSVQIIDSLGPSWNQTVESKAACFPFEVNSSFFKDAGDISLVVDYKLTVTRHWLAVFKDAFAEALALVGYLEIGATVFVIVALSSCKAVHPLRTEMSYLDVALNESTDHDTLLNDHQTIAAMQAEVERLKAERRKSGQLDQCRLSEIQKHVTNLTRTSDSDGIVHTLLENRGSPRALKAEAGEP